MNGKERALKLVETMGEAVRKDSWANVLTGLGTMARDKLMSTAFQPLGKRLGDEQLESLYHEDDMAARVAELLPEDSLRAGFEVKVEASDDDAGDPDQAKPREPRTSDVDITDAVQIGSDVKGVLDDLQATAMLTDAGIWSRVFGGASVLIGADDGADEEGMREPLNEDAVRSVDFLNVIDRRHMTPLSWYVDPTEAKFGRPRQYLLTPDLAPQGLTEASALALPSAMVVHESRLLVFEGTRVTIRQRRKNNGFGNSIYQRMHDVMVQFQTSWQSTAHLLQDASQGKFKIEGLIEMISSGDEETLLKRLQIMDLNRSTARAIALDAEMEDFTRDPHNLGGIGEVLDKFMLRLAAAARMPVTMLMGQSPAGMDATGESDRLVWFDSVMSYQQAVLLQHLERLTSLVMRSQQGPTGGNEPTNWSIQFNPLLHMTPKEEAELQKFVAERDKIYIDAGVVMPEEVALSRWPVTGWTPDTTIDLTLRKEILEVDKLPPEPDPDADPDPTPTPEPAADPTAEPEVDVAKAALNGAQSAFLLNVAAQVQGGDISKASGVASLLAANPTMTAAEAGAIAGDEPEDEPTAPVPPALANQPPPPPPQPLDENTGHLDDEEEERLDALLSDGDTYAVVVDDKVVSGHGTRAAADAVRMDGKVIRISTIMRRGGKHVLLDRTGKVIGTHDTRAQALAQQSRD